jgi:hypothetical protein
LNGIGPAEIPHYRWKAYDEAMNSRGSLLNWLDPTMSWHGQPSGKQGRGQMFSDLAIQLCPKMKCLSISRCARPWA